MEESVVPANLTSLGFGPVGNNVVGMGGNIHITKLTHTYVLIYSMYMNTYIHAKTHTHMHNHMCSYRIQFDFTFTHNPSSL